ncbi:MAG: NAD-dependent deacylase [Paludibacter sp.]|nr:NAD-dependent deacylase [Paludibacter sp.]
MKKIVVLTGAGMSAESGLSTFRGSDGLWANYHIEDVATPNAWRKNPALVLDFYNQLRKQLFDVEPNPGHIALADLEKHFDVQIITQNVDNLHERAGSTNVLHLHGELMKMRSTGSGEEVIDVLPDKIEFFIGDLCPKGFQLRPHIVWFGEAVPKIENAIKIVEKADILVVIGTSLKVYPAAGLIHNVKQGTPIYLIDPNEIDSLPSNIVVIKKGGNDGLQELREKYLKLK